MGSATSVERAAPEAVERLLRQLVDACFVLTDRDGAVTRWGRPAQDLFGWASAQTVGRPLFELLALDAAMLPGGGRVRGDAIRKDGSRIDVGFTLVPVSMSQSLEFNGFLEALEIVAPRGRALDRLQESHRSVVDWIGAAIAGHAELSEDEPAAGTIVTFQPLGQPPPPVAGEQPESVPGTAAAALDPSPADGRRAEELDRSLAEATAEAAATSARVTALEEAGGRLEGEVVETRGALAQVHKLVEGLRAELGQAVAAAAEGRESQQSELEELRRELSADDKAESLRAELANTQATVAELHEVADRAAGRDELQAALEQIATLAAGKDAHEDLRRDLDASRTAIDELGRRVADQSHDDELRGELENIRAAVEESATASHEALREQVSETREVVAELEERLAQGAVGARAQQADAGADGTPSAESAAIVERARAIAASVEEAVAAADARAGEASTAADSSRRLAEQAARAVQDATAASAAAQAVGRAAEDHVAAAEQAAARSGESATVAQQAVTDIGEVVAAVELTSSRAHEAAERAVHAGSDAAGHARRADEAITAMGEQTSMAEELATSAQAAADESREHAAAAAAAAAAAGRDADRAHDHQAGAEQAASAARKGTEARAAEAADVDQRAGHLKELAGRMELLLATVEQVAAAAERHAERAEAAAEQVESRPRAPHMDNEEDDFHAAGEARRPLITRRRAVGPAREPLPGFDDVPTPLAHIDLGGRFGALNSAFSDLVGYPEEEFRAASWPPVTDRANLGRHREQMRQMVAGEIDSAEVNTGYVHAQGLLVPVVGSLSLVRDAGEPRHFLLAVSGS